MSVDTPIWSPKHPELTQMSQFLNDVNHHHDTQLQNYQALHEWSVKNPALFWTECAHFLNFPIQDTPKTALIQHQHFWETQWFTQTTFNFAELLLKGEPEKIAIAAYDERGKQITLTYATLKEKVAQCKHGLISQGVTAGDRVVAVMPNIPETIIAMLATSAIGAIFSSCSPDFGINATLERLGQLEPKVLFICDGHQYSGKLFSSEEKITHLKANISSLNHTVIIPFIDNGLAAQPYPNQSSFSQFGVKTDLGPLKSFPFNHPLYILFSSGTTGKPKCIMHSAGGTLLQHLKELRLHTDLQAKDKLLFYTTCGWMMWNWMVSGLALGLTLVLYEGSPFYPSPTSLFKIIDEEQVTVFGTSARYLMSLEKSNERIQDHFKLNSLRMILSTGSPLLPHQYDFVNEHIKNNVALCSISGGTDIISCFALGNPMLPIYRGEIQSLGLGMDVAILNDEGQENAFEQGELVCKTPFPSMPIGFWKDMDHQAYQRAYFQRFPGVWAHGDFAQITTHHGLVILGRSDAILNPGGVRIGSAEIYRPLENIPEIQDSVVIGQNYHHDVRIILFVQLKPGFVLNPALKNKICMALKTEASPRHVPAKIIAVPDIPKTLNGKVVELAIKQLVEGKAIQNLNSIANPEALEYFKNCPELNEP